MRVRVRLEVELRERGRADGIELRWLYLCGRGREGERAGEERDGQSQWLRNLLGNICFCVSALLKAVPLAGHSPSPPTIHPRPPAFPKSIITLAAASDYSQNNVALAHPHPPLRTVTIASPHQALPAWPCPIIHKIEMPKHPTISRLLPSHVPWL